GRGRTHTFGRDERNLAVPLSASIKGFDQVVPSRELAVVDLAEIQPLPLDDLAAGAALALDDIPVAMFFAVFEASVGSQKHDANQPTPTGTIDKGTRSTLQAFCQ